MNHQEHRTPSWVSATLLALAFICSNAVEAMPFLSDDFNPATMEPNPTWRFYDPYDTTGGKDPGESTLTLDGTNALINIPAGLNHDLWVTPNNKAPRYLQDASDTNFKIEVKFETTPNVSNQSQGIIVQQANDAFLRFDIFYGNATKLFVAYVDGATSTVHKSVTVLPNSPKYQQVIRSGDQWTFRYSNNGTAWTNAVTFTQSLTVTEVGFFAGTSGSNPDFLSSVDYFMDADDPIVDNDVWAAPAPVISAWYDYKQPFGQPGTSQKWANILGNVFSNTELSALTYKLNGGSEQSLRFGPDTKRLLGTGDFNIELDHTSLSVGSNTIGIKATDINDLVTTKTVTFDYSPGSIWPLPYTADWGTLTDIKQVESIAHIVDGLWKLTPDGIRSVQQGYDRAIAIGDITWPSNYQVTVPITLHSHFNGIGFAVGWQGHEGVQSPKLGWPLQALAWIRGPFNNPTLDIVTYGGNGGSQGEVVEATQPISPITFNETYMLKSSSEPLNDGSGKSTFKVKFWRQSDPEPTAWNISADIPTRDGSVLLVGWFAKATFGNVNIVPLSGNNIEPLPGNQSPTAVATGTPTSGDAPLNVAFDGSGSTDDGTITTYAWDFGDGSPISSQVSPTHTYAASGNYTVTLAVTDDGGLTDTDTVNITVNDPVGNLTPTAVATGTPTSGNSPLDVIFDGSGSSDADGSITSYAWDFGDGSPVSNLVSPTHTYAVSGNYTATLTVSDDGGLTDTATVPITVSGTGNTSGMVSDDFNQPLNNSVWTFVDPVGDSTLSETGTQMAISVPAGSNHNLWKNALFAPRIRQAANNTDFEVEVKFDSTLSAKYQLQGIALEQDNTNLVRFDFYSDGSVTRIFSASFVNGIPTKRIQTVITDGVPLYLRVTREADQWTMSYSYDGASWIVGGVYTHNLAVTSVAIFGGNAGPTPPAHTALIDYFMVNGNPPGGGSGTQPPVEDIQTSVTDPTTASGMVSDTFDKPLDTNVWSFYDPVGDSILSMTGTEAAILVPAGTRHDLWKNSLTAPRIRQAANNTDFEVEVKFDSALSAQYQLQGITVEQDNTNLLRFDFYSNGSVTRIFSASFVNGAPSIRIQSIITDGDPLYLRVAREADQWTMSYSYDGASWIVGGVYTHNLAVTSVAIFGGNAGSALPAHTTLIDYFMVNDNI